jgi:glycosyltransferase involved in cell wall biosynthesis/dienelactone hydrolase/uncharacterized membrane protein YbhN (UPF0104 family)
MDPETPVAPTTTGDALPAAPVRVLLANDHHGWGGTTLHGIGKLFLLWLPRFDGVRARVTTCILRRRDALDEFFVEKDLRVEYFSRRRFSPLTLVDFLRVIRRDRIDVMHLQGYASCTFGRIASMLTGVPVVMQCHSVDPRYKLYMALADRVLAHRTDRCLTLCETVRRFVVDRQHVREERVETFPLGIDLEEFRPRSAADVAAARESLGIVPGPRVVGTMTRLFEQKGNAYFLEAVSMLAPAHPDVVFLVAGEGPLRAELEAQARKLGIDDRVRFLGFQKDAPAVLSTFEVAVLASLWEATPLTAYEALAMGKPIVSTNVDGLSEILEDGRTARLVPPRNPDALAREIDRVLGDPELAARMSANALEASRRFSVDGYVRRLETIYADVAREGRRRRERRKRRWSFRARLVFTTILFLVLLSQVDLRSILNPLSSAALAPLAGAALLVVLDRAISFWRWHVLVRAQPIATSVAETARTFFVGNFLGLFLPLGVGPDVLRAASMGLGRGAGIEAAGAILVERALGLVALLAAALVGVVVAPSDALPAGARAPAAIVLGLSLAAILAAALSRDRIARAARGAPFRWARRLASALALYRERPRLLAGAFVLSLAIQVLRVGIVLSIALALHQSLPLASFALAAPVTHAASLLPVTLGGFGAREAASYVCFTRLGVEGGIAITIGVLQFAASLFGALPGLPWLLVVREAAPRPRRPTRRRVVRAVRRTAIASLMVAALVFAGLVVSPGLRANLPWTKREAFERALLRGSLLDRRLLRFGDGETVRVESRGLSLVATLERGRGPEPRPGIVLLHGSSPLGRKLAIYRVLGSRLAARGFTVLAPDVAAFGDSPRPTPPSGDAWDPESLDGIADAHAAAATLAALPGVDAAHVYAVGHSMGGSIALVAGLSDARVAKVVAIGPSRRSLERTDTDEERRSFLARFRRDRALERQVPWEVVRRVLETHRVERATEPLRVAGHKPTLLVDGGLEDPADHAALADLLPAFAPPPVRLETIPAADHYLNALGLDASDHWVLYDRRAVDAAVDAIVRFLEEP